MFIRHPGSKQLHVANNHNTKEGADQENSRPDKANDTQSTGVPELKILKSAEK